MIDAIRAERIKLLSIRSPYWCLGLAVVLGIGLTTLFSSTIGSMSEITDSGSADPDSADGSALQVLLVGVYEFAVIVLMIMAILGITSEYRFSTIRATFLAVPHRTVALGAKAAVHAATTFVVLLVLTLVCLLITSATLGGVDFGAGDVVRQIWGVPLYGALSVLLAIGVGALVRQTAGAISLVLVWMLVIETILQTVPKVRDSIAPLLPFANGRHFLSGGSADDDFFWGAYPSIVYFAVWAIVIFVAGVAVTNRRDA